MLKGWDLRYTNGGIGCACQIIRSVQLITIFLHIFKIILHLIGGVSILHPFGVICLVSV